MAELKLPGTNLVEVPFAPNMPRKKDHAKNVPPLKKLVLVETPLAF